MRYTLTVPKPCSEKWSKMTPTQKGAFCTSCQKEVIDFSNTSNYELYRQLSNEKPICGRFRPIQLNRRILDSSQSKWRQHVTSLGFTSLVFLSVQVIAQAQKPSITEILQHKMPVCGLMDPEVQPSDSIVIKGLVEDMESPLPGALIMIKGTTIGTQSDFDGNFSIKIPAFYLEKEPTLAFSYIGYETKEIKIDNNSKFVNAKFTEESYAILGELVVVRKMNFIRRIGNWFRKL